MLRPPLSRALRTIVASLGLLLVGCASTGRVQQRVEQSLIAGDYGRALELVERERDRTYRGRNRLLYHLEKGMLLHYDRRYAESNAEFEAAKRLGDDLYSRSVSNEGLALMTNDYALDYAGENFERTLVHLFSAMNYALLGEQDSALVEARQVGEYLRKLQVDSTTPNTYQEDAFARYLSALLYEAAGEYDSALVDYKKAITAYADYQEEFGVPRPASLFANAERVAARLGPWAREDLAALGSPGEPLEIPKGHGELILIHYNGLSPVKDQIRITIPFSEAWLFVAALQGIADPAARREIERATTFVSALRGVDVVSVAFPTFVDRAYSIERMEPRVPTAARILGPELVEDVGEIAKKDLEDRRTRIYAKTVARAAIKYAIQKGAELAARRADDDYGSLLVAGTQILGNIARYASEQADKRVWSTLPDEIWMASAIVPAGRHDVAVDFVTARSTVVETRLLQGIEVAPGERRFVVLRTAR